MARRKAWIAGVTLLLLLLTCDQVHGHEQHQGKSAIFLHQVTMRAFGFFVIGAACFVEEPE